jgi:alkylhydroperoxidase/carboxymuconolactone decarboxylase family protein YurZ
MCGTHAKTPCDPETVVQKCPGVALAGQLDSEFQDILRRYHHRIWGGAGVIPAKYKYLMALATAVTGREKERALLETNKALAYGATPEEIRETLELGGGLGGSPLLVEGVGPVLRFLEKQAAGAADHVPTDGAK